MRTERPGEEELWTRKAKLSVDKPECFCLTQTQNSGRRYENWTSGTSKSWHKSSQDTLHYRGTWKSWRLSKMEPVNTALKRMNLLNIMSQIAWPSCTKEGKPLVHSSWSRKKWKVLNLMHFSSTSGSQKGGKCKGKLAWHTDTQTQKHKSKIYQKRNLWQFLGTDLWWTQY